MVSGDFPSFYLLNSGWQYEKVSATTVQSIHISKEPATAAAQRSPALFCSFYCKTQVIIL